MEQTAFGKKLTEIRNAKGLTQDELAKKCKVSLRTIQRIESGVVKPRAFTTRALSEILEIDFFDASNYTREDAKINHHSNTKWYSSLLWHLKDLFNLKTNTMKKLSILSAIACLIILGILSITNNFSTLQVKTQKVEIPKVEVANSPKFLKIYGGEINYRFPKGELGWSGEINDTLYYFLKKDLIQTSKNNIFLNRSFVGKAFAGDTVIYKNRKVIIKSPYCEFLEFNSHGLNYKFQEGEMKMSSRVKDTAYHYLKKDLVQEYKNKIFLNGFFVGKALIGDTIIYRNREVIIKSTYAKFVKFNVYGINYKYPKDEIEMSSRINDTTYHFLKGALIQEYKSKIFLNRSFVGMALVGDTVIYQNRKIIIKSAYSE